MEKLRRKDIFMEDSNFFKDLKIKRKTEEAEMFELIMDSVCGGRGKHISKELREKVSSKFKEECKMFRGYMKSLKVEPLKRR